MHSSSIDPSAQLIVLLDALAGNSVNDRVQAWIHIAHHVGDAEHSHRQDEASPEEKIEQRRVLIAVESGPVLQSDVACCINDRISIGCSLSSVVDLGGNRSCRGDI